MQPRPVVSAHSAAAPSMRVDAAAVLLWGMVGVAWSVVIAADWSGAGALVHHHALIEGGPPLPVALLVFVPTWLVMVVGMMVPASTVAIGLHAASQTRELLARVRFLGAFLAVWAGFGLFCFVGDMAVHRLVDASPWLAAHSALIAAGLVGTAGVYQLLSIKQRYLASCRVPLAHFDRDGLTAGAAHGVDCVGSSGALMLLMFAAGFASLPWMLGLTGLMFYEARGRHGAVVARLAGIFLLWLAVLTTVSGAAPGFAAG